MLRRVVDRASFADIRSGRKPDKLCERKPENKSMPQLIQVIQEENIRSFLLIKVITRIIELHRIYLGFSGNIRKC